MSLSRRLLCAFALTLSLNASAQQPPAAAEDPKVQALLSDYLNSWLTPDKAARVAKLEKIWTPGALHESPFARSVGLAAINDEIEGFHKMFPGAKVKFGTPKRTGHFLLVSFELHKADGSLVVAGYDYFELDEAGKIVRVIGFV